MAKKKAKKEESFLTPEHLKKWLTDNRKWMSDNIDKVGDNVEKRFKQVLHMMNLPSKEQITKVEKSLKTSRGEPITPCGCARSVYLHVKEGEVEELKEFLETKIDAEIMRTDEAVTQGLFGTKEVGEKFYSRAGELLIIPNDKKAIWYDDWEQTGYHGGLHENEMHTPLCITRLSDLTE